MNITQKGRYALKALLTLREATPIKPRTLRDVASHEQIPLKFLEQIMIPLKRAGIVDSSKGKRGGYWLAERPERISLGQVIRVIDGPLSPFGKRTALESLIQKEEAHPALYEIFLEVGNAVASILDTRSLADICERSLQLRQQKASCGIYDI